MALRALICALPKLCPRGSRSVAKKAVSSQSGKISTNSAMQSVSILCSGNSADELMEALMCFGASSCSIEAANRTEGQLDGPVPWQNASHEFWSKSHITALFERDVSVPESLALAADTLGWKDVPKYELTIVEETDWVDQVKDAFQPVQVLPGYWIVPEWSKAPDSEAINIILNPGLAFGTGEHPTTRLCLKWLHKAVKGGENILDYGTGSGILGIAALKMGASHAVGVDIDPMAISSANSNAALNNLEPHSFEAFIASDGDEEPVPHGPETFDIVVANILLNPLVTVSARIVSYARIGGVVGLSGIILEQVERVAQAYSPLLKDIEVAEEDGWACLCGTRK